MRTRAAKVGAGITTGAFVANEIARVTLRSPFFKIKIQNVAAVLLLPTFFAKQAYDNDVEKRIENLWRVHKNRVDRGMGGTWRSDGHHESNK